MSFLSFHTPTLLKSFPHSTPPSHLSPQVVPIAHPSLKDVLDPVTDLHEDVKRKALLRLEYENLTNCEAITTPASKYYKKPADYAINRYAYYVCYKCKKVCLGIRLSAWGHSVCRFPDVLFVPCRRTTGVRLCVLRLPVTSTIQRSWCAAGALM